jgi:hypothetical protein
MSERIEIKTRLENWQHEAGDSAFSGPNAFGGI